MKAIKHLAHLIMALALTLSCTNSASWQNEEPFLILGGELGNSSAACEADIERNFSKLAKMGLNTVLVPAYWDHIEPEQGVFDFTLTDKVLAEASNNGLKVIFLWFGAWKNSMSCYAPSWVKTDWETYPRACTKEGKPLEILSAFSENVFKADSAAFITWLDYLKKKDRGQVVMIQIENEIGMLESARDHSAVADSLFAAEVPHALLEYMKSDKDGLQPHLLNKWSSRGCPDSGSWTEVFGEGIYTDEIFMAWHYAQYVERMAKAARKIYDIPLYVNAAMNSRGRKPGEYPSAGPLAHLSDIWHCAAPDIDILAPDLYDSGFKDWTASYAMEDNPLFIPEIRRADNNGAQAFYAFGEHSAVGFSPFAIEDSQFQDPQDLPLCRAYSVLEELAPLIVRNSRWSIGPGGLADNGKVDDRTMWGLLFSYDDKERIITDGDIVMTCRHNFTLPWDPRATDGSVWPETGGIIIRLNDHEYIVAGEGVVVEFALNNSLTKAGSGKSAGPLLGEDGFVLAGSADSATGKNEPAEVQGLWSGERCGLESVDEVSIAREGTIKRIRRLSGDQTHQGRHVRISVGDCSILYVKLYKYQ